MPTRTCGRVTMAAMQDAGTDARLAAIVAEARAGRRVVCCRACGAVGRLSSDLCMSDYTLIELAELATAGHVNIENGAGGPSMGIHQSWHEETWR